MRRFALCLALLCSGCPALAAAAAVEGGEVEDHEPRPPTPKAAATPATTSTTTPSPSLPTAPPDDATYTLLVGEAVSATNPRLARTTSSIGKGKYVAMKFETSADGFGMDGVDVTLYVLDGGSRSVATHKRSPLKPTDDVLYKSWQITKKGTFAIEVKSPTGKLLASATFSVV